MKITHIGLPFVLRRRFCPNAPGHIVPWHFFWEMSDQFVEGVSTHFTSAEFVIQEDGLLAIIACRPHLSADAQHCASLWMARHGVPTEADLAAVPEIVRRRMATVCRVYGRARCDALWAVAAVDFLRNGRLFGDGE